jgi:hypothetical protein
LIYEDPNTKIPREKDIIGTKRQLSNLEKHSIDYDVRIFVECKEIKNTEVFLENDMKIGDAFISDRIQFLNVHEVRRYKALHFYKHKSMVFNQKDSKDLLHKPINQNLQSLRAFRKEKERERNLYFLTIVFDGQIQFKDRNNIIQELDRGLIHIETISRAYNLPHNNCIIELVSIGKLQDYLEDINKGIEEINDMIFFNYKEEKERVTKNRKEKFNEYC